MGSCEPAVMSLESKAVSARVKHVIKLILTPVLRVINYQLMLPLGVK